MDDSDKNLLKIGCLLTIPKQEYQVANELENSYFLSVIELFRTKITLEIELPININICRDQNFSSFFMYLTQSYI